MLGSEHNALRPIAYDLSLQPAVPRGESVDSSLDAHRETGLASDKPNSQQEKTARFAATMDDVVGTERRSVPIGLEDVADASEFAADQPAAGVVFVCLLALSEFRSEHSFESYCGGAGQQNEVDYGGYRWEERADSCGKDLASPVDSFHSVLRIWVVVYSPCYV